MPSTSVLDAPDPAKVANPPVCYVAVAERNLVIAIFRSDDRHLVPGTRMHVQFRAGEHGFPDGAVVHYVDKEHGRVHDRTDAVPWENWRPLPFAPIACEDKPLLFRVFRDANEARDELTRKRESMGN